MFTIGGAFLFILKRERTGLVRSYMPSVRCPALLGGRVAFRAKAKRAVGGGGILAMYLYE